MTALGRQWPEREKHIENGYYELNECNQDYLYGYI